MNKLRIIFLCSSRFALPALKELAFFQMLTVVAIPQHCDEMLEQVQGLLYGTGIPVIALDKENYTIELKNTIEKYKPEMGLMMTFSFKIPSAIYNLLPIGFFNVHPGPLPQYRGADPIFQQIKNREPFAGVTIHKLDEGIDTGPVVICEMIKIEVTDTYGLLTTKLSLVAAKLSGILIKMAAFKFAIPAKPQDETKARYYKRQQAKDISINWKTMHADEIVSLINACNPWNKGAVTRINNQVIRLLDAEKIGRDNTRGFTEPGTILSISEKETVVSTIINEAISIKIFYCDEGFCSGKILHVIGIRPAMQFENI